MGRKAETAVKEPAPAQNEAVADRDVEAADLPGPSTLAGPRSPAIRFSLVRMVRAQSHLLVATTTTVGGELVGDYAELRPDQVSSPRSIEFVGGLMTERINAYLQRKGLGSPI